ncbi:tRNA (adenosine(37)-N6)-threonylcarbamoyltransferase complex ATPase subunit type 1 TsaE [Patescibacteria group bacterium]|nr:tRNA (adenosine(37)-N6)-threonylcarbamoyltransferase complex ATPase subunit type 1 TsaE [Patescibacteria group bacterium]
MVKFFKKNKRLEVLTKSPTQTKKLGKILAGEFLKTSRKKALVLGLIGDLGGGKTTFLQGFARGLGIKEKILSPSFVIMKKFRVPVANIPCQISNFYHFDCYRIEKPKEILNLGFKEIISDPRNIVTIEWADHITKILPKDTKILKFKFVDRKTRKITIENKELD